MIFHFWNVLAPAVHPTLSLRTKKARTLKNRQRRSSHNRAGPSAWGASASPSKSGFSTLISRHLLYLSPVSPSKTNFFSRHTYDKIYFFAQFSMCCPEFAKLMNMLRRKLTSIQYCSKGEYVNYRYCTDRSHFAEKRSIDLFRDIYPPSRSDGRGLPELRYICHLSDLLFVS